MNNGINPNAVLVFGIIVGLTLALSFYLGAKAKSAKGFFAAGGDIPWFINGIAFAGDYLSAASFLGNLVVVKKSGLKWWIKAGDPSFTSECNIFSFCSTS